MYLMLLKIQYLLLETGFEKEFEVVGSVVLVR
jgi:hypothetical protein